MARTGKAPGDCLAVKQGLYVVPAVVKKEGQQRAHPDRRQAQGPLGIRAGHFFRLKECGQLIGGRKGLLEEVYQSYIEDALVFSFNDTMPFIGKY